MNQDTGEKAVRAITEMRYILYIYILQLKQKSLIKSFRIIHNNLLWTDFIVLASTKTLGSMEGLKVNYLGFVTNCLHKIEYFYADSVHCIFCLNNSS